LLVRQERKVVTALFCDLVGFTSRAEEMDPEDVAALLAPYHARLKDELERRGGTVEKFIGDAVMALFGAPVAHEDDPERAVRAALAIRDFARDEGLELRVGITTGEALVAVDARPELGETMATGDVINTAARLQAAAPINGVLVGDATYRATREAIEYDEREPVEAKGKARAVPVWEVVAPRARITLDRLHGTPLVGRSHELTLLDGALTRAQQELSPQLVTLVGVPGIGKSRLVFELSQLIDRRPEIITWRQGRCLPYGDGVTFWALGEIVKAQAGILETDSAETTQAKLRNVVSDPWVESYLGPLVGLAAEHELGGDRRGEAFAAWRQFVESLAEERPLVTVIEDLHWADETLLDFVDHLVDWASGIALLVVCTARPELLERRTAWGGGKPNALTLSLSPLSDDETARLIAGLLERSVLPAETQQALLVRAGGNPLYAEQFARMLEEGGAVEEERLPETVQGLIASRLDLLPADEKAVLQDGAVLGKTFWTGGVAKLSEIDAEELSRSLHALERKQFVRRERQSTVADETEHAFRHLLVRDVAYGQIPRAERAEKHRLAAEWIESLRRSEDQAEMLAHHYLQALELTRAAGGDVEPLADRARLALRDAGDRALGLYALSAAARFYAAAIELWPEGDADLPQLLFRYGSSVRKSERGAEALERAYDALIAAGEREAAAASLAMLATLAWHRGDSALSFERLEGAAGLLSDAPASPEKAFVLSQVCRYRMLAGEAEDALRVGSEALAMAEALGLEDVRASTLNSMGTARANTGDMRGIEELELSIAVALAANSSECVRGYTNLSAIYMETAQLDLAERTGTEGIRAAERFGDEIDLRFIRGHRMTYAYFAGRWDECLALAPEFIGSEAEASRHYLEAEARCVRGVIELARDDVAGAVGDIDAALVHAQRIKDPQVWAPTLAVAISVFHEVGFVDRVEPLVRELLQYWAPGAPAAANSAERAVWALLDLGYVGPLLEQLERAIAVPWTDASKAIAGGDLVAAAEIYRDIGALPWEAEVRLRAAKQLVADGRRSEADEQLARALAFYRSVGATRYIREGEALLAAAS
jgi:class 3 adenylate cyclase/tetratricopeptide (TPR) repeat protein